MTLTPNALACVVCRRGDKTVKLRAIGEGLSAQICADCLASPFRVAEARRRVEATS